MANRTKSLEQFVRRGAAAQEAVNDMTKQMRLGYSSPVLTTRERMTALALSFPELARCLRDFVQPFEAMKLDKAIGGQGHGCICAAKFVLSVWNPTTRWKSGRFDIHDALGVWDDAHRAAFVAWAKDPWWP